MHLLDYIFIVVIIFHYADVAELADALDLGSSVPDVQVRFLSSAFFIASFSLLFTYYSQIFFVKSLKYPHFPHSFLSQSFLFHTLLLTLFNIVEISIAISCKMTDIYNIVPWYYFIL